MYREMNGVYLHSPHQPCKKDCCPSVPCLNKGEEVIIRGSPIVACVHLSTAIEYCNSSSSKLSPNTAAAPKAPSKLSPNTTTVRKSPSKPVTQSHTKDCTRKIPLLHCPLGRCEQKYENIFKHFKTKHDVIRLNLTVPLFYRLKNITRDMFVIYEPRNDVYFIGNIEESYQKNIYFEMQVVYNYKNKCCGHPKFVFNIPGVVTNRFIDVYKNRNTFGKTRRLEILKDNLKKTTGLKMFYEMKIIVRLK